MRQNDLAEMIKLLSKKNRRVYFKTEDEDYYEITKVYLQDDEKMILEGEK